MESRQVQGAAAAGRGLQVQQPQQQMVMASTSSSYPSNSALISPNPTANIPSSSTPRFSFNSSTSLPSHHQHYLQQHHQNQQQPEPLELHHQNQQQPKPLDSLNSAGFDGSSQFGCNTELSMKKKRGRPRKYAPDGSIALLQLAPTTPISTNSANHRDSDSVGLGSSNGGVGVASEPLSKRNRGRPPGSGKRQINALGGIGGVGFTPHVITVNTGEDVASKIMAFSQQGPRTVCILSASGAISNVTLRQPSMSGAIVKYEGQYEIISLSGSLLVSENYGSLIRAGGLSVSLAGSDGQVLGGGVAGMLQAASPVTVIVGSFIVDGKKQNLDVLKTGPSSIQPSNVLNFRAPGRTGSPPPQGCSSESSDENGSSPLNQGSGFCNNSASPSIHNNNIQMFPRWTGHTPQ